jgi:hypothetical protein
MRIDAPTRLRATFDEGDYAPIETPEVPEDPLKFSDGKSYKDRLAAARKAAGRKDTMAIGFGELDGTPAVVIVQDFTFMGGSLGMAAGEAFIHTGHLPDDFVEESLGTAAPPGDPLAADPGAAPGADARPAADPANTLQQAEIAMIRQVLDAAGGNISEASKRLGISRNTVYRKLRGSLPPRAR